jgi:hypothetical protein
MVDRQGIAVSTEGCSPGKRLLSGGIVEVVSKSIAGLQVLSGDIELRFSNSIDWSVGGEVSKVGTGIQIFKVCEAGRYRLERRLVDYG